MWANIFGPAAPPMRTRGRGFWIGLGHCQEGSKRTNSPEKDATSFAQSACIASIFSRTSSRRRFGSMPWFSISSWFQPKPIPKTKRPSLIQSRVEICFAKVIASCWAGRPMPVPSRIFFVTEAAAARAM
jgi:hypothetical protein